MVDCEVSEGMDGWLRCLEMKMVVSGGNEGSGDEWEEMEDGTCCWVAGEDLGAVRGGKNLECLERKGILGAWGNRVWGVSGRGGLEMLGRRRIRVHLEALRSSAAVRLPPLPRLTEEGRQMGHRLEEGPRLDLLVRGERLQQVLRQQRHFGVEARGDAPAGTAGIYTAPPAAAAVSAGAVTAARRRLWGRQRRHFRSHCARVAERSAPPAGGAPKRPAAPPPRPASAHSRPIRARRRARPPNPRPSPQIPALLLVSGRGPASAGAEARGLVGPGPPR